MTMSKLQLYDKDANFPVFGFGAKLPPYHIMMSTCFALNGNIFHPLCHKVKGILKAYNKCLQEI